MRISRVSSVPRPTETRCKRTCAISKPTTFPMGLIIYLVQSRGNKGSPLALREVGSARKFIVSRIGWQSPSSLGARGLLCPLQGRRGFVGDPSEFRHCRPFFDSLSNFLASVVPIHSKAVIANSDRRSSKVGIITRFARILAMRSRLSADSSPSMAFASARSARRPTLRNVLLAFSRTAKRASSSCSIICAVFSAGGSGNSATA